MKEKGYLGGLGGVARSNDNYTKIPLTSNDKSTFNPWVKLQQNNPMISIYINPSEDMLLMAPTHKA